MAGADVAVVLPSALRPLAGGAARLTVAADTVGTALDALRDEHPLLERRIRDEQGQVRRHLMVYVGDTDIRDLDGLDTALPPGGEMFVVTAVSGG